MFYTHVLLANKCTSSPILPDLQNFSDFEQVSLFFSIEKVYKRRVYNFVDKYFDLD